MKCSICGELVTNKGRHHATVLKCGHIFGSGCILQWLNGHHTCPLCKSESTYKNAIKIISDDIVVLDEARVAELSKSVEMGRIYQFELEDKCKKYMDTIREQEEKIKSLEAIIKNKNSSAANDSTREDSSCHAEDQGPSANAEKRVCETTEEDTTQKKARTQEESAPKKQVEEVDKERASNSADPGPENTTAPVSSSTTPSKDSTSATTTTISQLLPTPGPDTRTQPESIPPAKNGITSPDVPNNNSPIDNPSVDNTTPTSFSQPIQLGHHLSPPLKPLVMFYSQKIPPTTEERQASLHVQCPLPLTRDHQDGPSTGLPLPVPSIRNQVHPLPSSSNNNQPTGSSIPGRSSTLPLNAPLPNPQSAPITIFPLPNPHTTPPPSISNSRTISLSHLPSQSSNPTSSTTTTNPRSSTLPALPSTTEETESSPPLPFDSTLNTVCISPFRNHHSTRSLFSFNVPLPAEMQVPTIS